jgi:hypothetical protein
VCTAAETADRLQQVVAQMLPTMVIQHRASPSPSPTPSPSPSPTPSPTPSPSPTQSPSRAGLIAGTAVTAVAAAGALVMLGFGGHALSIDGEPTTSLLPPVTQAPMRYDTQAAGIGLVASGSLLLVGAATGLAFEIRALRRR